MLPTWKKKKSLASGHKKKKSFCFPGTAETAKMVQHDKTQRTDYDVDSMTGYLKEQSFLTTLLPAVQMQLILM